MAACAASTTEERQRRHGADFREDDREWWHTVKLWVVAERDESRAHRGDSFIALGGVLHKDSNGGVEEESMACTTVVMWVHG